MQTISNQADKPFAVMSATKQQVKFNGRKGLSRQEVKLVTFIYKYMV